MSIEIDYLAWYCPRIGLLTAATFGTEQRGLDCNVNLDGETQPLTGAAARAHRASRNSLETFPFFPAAALAVVLTRNNSAHTARDATLYFWRA